MSENDTKLPNPVGPPTIFTPELFLTICDRLSNGESLRSVCRDETMPDKKTVLRWIRDDDQLRIQYARAKEESADALVDEMIEIADDASNDFMTIEKGNSSYEVENREVTNRSKLRVETRKWIASKLKPKRYGDKLDVTSGGRAIRPPATVSVIEARNAINQPQATESS